MLLALGVAVTVAPHLGQIQARQEIQDPPAVTPERVAIAPTEKDTSAPIDSRPAASEPDTVASAASTSLGVAEPILSGPLGGLLPDITLLATDMRHYATEDFTIDRRLKYTGRDEHAARKLLEEANYVGLEVKYDSNCNRGIGPGEVRHAIFQIDQFDTVALAKEYWDMPVPTDPTYIIWDRTALDGKDAWLGEQLIKCGNASSNLHWRTMRVGNIYLHVGLFSADETQIDPEIAALSERLVRSMASKIPDSGF